MYFPLGFYLLNLVFYHYCVLKRWRTDKRLAALQSMLQFDEVPSLGENKQNYLLVALIYLGHVAINERGYIRTSPFFQRTPTVMPRHVLVPVSTFLKKYLLSNIHGESHRLLIVIFPTLFASISTQCLSFAFLHCTLVAQLMKCYGLSAELKPN